MLSKNLQPKITDLQKDVIALLKRTNSLFGKVIELLNADQSDEKFKQRRKSIRQELSKVKNLELVMSIVAPMKAGKSTIVNAIVGHDILPSRNSAMTTLPTQIFFNLDYSTEKLLLSKKLITKFNSTVNKLNQAISKTGLDKAKDKLSTYPHLQALLETIHLKRDSILFSDELVGKKNILPILTILNDLVRLCNVFQPSINPLNNLSDVPKILTPIWRENKSEDIDQLGNLIIVDTPGPNEASANAQLLQVVQSQLQRSSIVLIILDFTQLKNIASEEVKQEVEKVINVKGKENLFVLINKVDQRREGDMSPQEVKEFVKAEFGLEDNDGKSKVFEVAAIWAFSATNFLREINQNPKSNISNLDSAKALAKEAFGAFWEEDFESTTKEELTKKANSLWKKSGFPLFLENVIDELMIQIAPRTINSALNTASSYLHELQSYLRLRKTGILKDKKELKQQVSALIQDLDEIEASRNRIPTVKEIKNNLEKKTRKRIEEAKATAMVSLDTYFDLEDYNRASKLEKVAIKVTRPLLKLIPSLKDKKEKFEFNSKSKAKDFSNRAINIAIQRASKLLDEIQTQTDEEINLAIKRLLKVLKSETGPIIERAKERLKKSFDLDLTIPEMEDTIISEIEPIRPDVETHTKTIDKGYGTRKVKKRTWRRLWLWKTEVTERYKKKDSYEDYYVVFLDKVISDVNRQIEDSFDNNSNNLIKYLDEDLQSYINGFYNNLDRYLSTYKDSLEQSQDDQELAEKEKEELVENLALLIKEASEAGKDSDKYSKYITQLTNY